MKQAIGVEAVPGRRRVALFVSILTGASLVGGAAVLEGGLRLAGRLGGGVTRAQSAASKGSRDADDDPQLGFRIKPNAAGSDAWGFRNPKVPERADIVALGDSQTWGYNAAAGASWPAQLGRLTGRTVYNMGMPSYGTVQYWALLEKALSLRPKIVVVGFYFGNDFWDAASLAYQSDSYRELRDPALRLDPRHDAVAARWEQRLQEIQGYEKRYLWHRVTDFLTNHTETVRVLQVRGWWPEINFRVGHDYAVANPEVSSWFDDGRLRTILNTDIRRLTLDPAEPTIREGIRITKELFARMQARAAGAGAHLLVAWIHNKEFLFYPLYKERYGTPAATYQKLMDLESEHQRDLEAQFQGEGIAWFDPLPEMEAALRRGEPIYPEGGDGHPTARGYAAIARAVEGEIERRGW